MSSQVERPVAPNTATDLLVVDDHHLARLGLITLVLSHAADTGRRLRILQARNLSDAVQTYRANRMSIGLVLLDLHVPDADGLSGLNRFLSLFPQAPVAVLSSKDDPGFVREAIARGARGHLPKPGDLKQAIVFIRSNGLFGEQARAEPEALDRTQWQLSTWHSADGQRLRLSERQAQVLDGVLKGASNPEIAEHFHLSEGTVKNHIAALLLLFRVRSRSRLIRQLR